MTKEQLARASMGFDARDWEQLVASGDPLDQLTVTNARATVDNIIRALPEVAALLGASE